MSSGNHRPATGPFVDRLIRIFRDRPVDDTSALVLIAYADEAIAALAPASPAGGEAEPPAGDGIADLLRTLLQERNHRTDGDLRELAERCLHLSRGDRDLIAMRGSIADDLTQRLAAVEARWALVFDGSAVYRNLSKEAQLRTGSVAVSDVLDALNRAAKAHEAAPQPAARSSDCTHGPDEDAPVIEFLDGFEVGAGKSPVRASLRAGEGE